MAACKDWALQLADRVGVAEVMFVREVNAKICSAFTVVGYEDPAGLVTRGHPHRVIESIVRCH